LIKQRTLKQTIHATGVGLHTGAKVLVTLQPAPPNHGIRFRRSDLDPTVTIPADPRYVSDTLLSTNLTYAGARVATVEHLLSAAAGLGIDNMIVDLSAAEVPIMDGSAAPFVFLLQSAGIAEQAVAKRFIRMRQPLQVSEGDAWARLAPASGFQIDFTIDFDHPVMRAGEQRAYLDLTHTSYVKAISRARTFGFMRDIEALRERGLARGGSFDNAIVLDDFRVLNEGGLRYPDEFVKHKMLDAIGDLYLLGRSLIGNFSAYKSGHRLNHQLLLKLLAQPDTWEEISFTTPTPPLPELGEQPLPGQA